jgi:hypothetical protein
MFSITGNALTSRIIDCGMKLVYLVEFSLNHALLLFAGLSTVELTMGCHGTPQT